MEEIYLAVLKDKGSEELLYVGESWCSAFSRLADFKYEASEDAEFSLITVLGKIERFSNDQL